MRTRCDAMTRRLAGHGSASAIIRYRQPVASLSMLACRTHLEQAGSELLFQEPHPIRALALDKHNSRLWAATTSSEVHAWHLPPRERAGARWVPPEGPSTSQGPAPMDTGPSQNHAFPTASSAVMRSRQTFPSGKRSRPAACLGHRTCCLACPLLSHAYPYLSCFKGGVAAGAPGLHAAHKAWACLQCECWHLGSAVKAAGHLLTIS